ncbi:hypothetical protein ST27_11370 [Xanthomonas phaseoli pv. phaseoli]|uniref:hypothetical protein n=1 Tax=Xanthomonas phaseoli TaxID=1985254 RepID=UPI0005960359|nr:hypothetical protein ST27_11370 [Xanthomonas phaseoli pv. phaseoli]
MDRAQFRTHLDHLDDAVPALRASSPDRCHFLRAFAGMAQIIEAKALTAQDAEFVGRRIKEILIWHELTDVEGQD